MRWDKAKIKLSFNLKLWEECVEKADNIDELEKCVEEVVTNREQQRKDEEKKQKEESKNRNLMHKEKARAEREAREQQRKIEEDERQKRLKAQEEERKRQADNSRPRRRLESIARLLESPNNVCVALAYVDGKYYAATNQNNIEPLRYDDDGTLWVSDLGGWTGKFERERSRDAAKVWKSFSERKDEVNEVVQVGKDLPNSVHAELKLLNYLVEIQIKGKIEIFVSKLCCEKCRIAIDEWNKIPGENVLCVETPGSHGDYFPGWKLPPCFSTHYKLKKTIADKIEMLGGEGNYRGRTLVRDTTRSQRNLSESPAPSDAKVGNANVVMGTAGEI